MPLGLERNTKPVQASAPRLVIRFGVAIVRAVDLKELAPANELALGLDKIRGEVRER